MPIKAYLRQQQSKTDYLEAQDADVCIYAPQYVLNLLQHLELQGKTIELMNEKQEIIDTITIGNPVTLKDLLRLTRNENLRPTEKITDELFDDENKALIRSLKDLATRCIIIGKTQVLKTGGFPRAQRKKSQQVSRPYDAYICDISGIEFQSSDSTGRLLLIPASHQHKSEIEKQNNETTAAGILTTGQLDHAFSLAAFGKDKATTEFCEANPDDFLRVVFKENDYFLDKSLFASLLAENMFISFLALNSQAEQNGNQVLFRMLQYGFDFLAGGLSEVGTGERLGQPDKQHYLTPCFLKALVNALTQLAPEQVEHIKVLELPLFKGLEEQKHWKTYCEEIERECQRLNIELITANHDPLFAPSDNLKAKYPKLVLATMNNGSPHNVLGNQMRYTDINAMIGENIAHKGHQFSPYLNFQMDEQAIFNGAPQINPARIIRGKAEVTDNLVNRLKNIREEADKLLPQFQDFNYDNIAPDKEKIKQALLSFETKFIAACASLSDVDKFYTLSLSDLILEYKQKRNRLASEGLPTDCVEKLQQECLLFEILFDFYHHLEKLSLALIDINKNFNEHSTSDDYSVPGTYSSSASQQDHGISIDGDLVEVSDNSATEYPFSGDSFSSSSSSSSSSTSHSHRSSSSSSSASSFVNVEQDSHSTEIASTPLLVAINNIQKLSQTFRNQFGGNKTHRVPKESSLTNNTLAAELRKPPKQTSWLKHTVFALVTTALLIIGIGASVALWWTGIPLLAAYPIAMMALTLTPGILSTMIASLATIKGLKNIFHERFVMDQYRLLTNPTAAPAPRRAALEDKKPTITLMDDELAQALTVEKILGLDSPMSDDSDFIDTLSSTNSAGSSSANTSPEHGAGPSSMDTFSEPDALPEVLPLDSFISGDSSGNIGHTTEVTATSTSTSPESQSDLDELLINNIVDTTTTVTTAPQTPVAGPSSSCSASKIITGMGDGFTTPKSHHRRAGSCDSPLKLDDTFTDFLRKTETGGRKFPKFHDNLLRQSQVLELPNEASSSTSTTESAGSATPGASTSAYTEDTASPINFKNPTDRDLKKLGLGFTSIRGPAFTTDDIGTRKRGFNPSTFN